MEGSEIEHSITIGSRALDTKIAEREHVHERDWYFRQSADCAVRGLA